VTAMIERALSALTDVRGVEGSFFATREGNVVARALPRIFDDETLSEVGPRLGRLLEALEDLGGSVDGAFVRHPSHAVLLRPAGDGILFVLTTSEVNVPSLKRGAALVARKIGNLLQDAPPEHAASQPPPMPPPPPVVAQETARATPPPVPPPQPTHHAPPSVSASRPSIPGMGGGVPGAPASRAVTFRGSKV
jgi:predicted regulator of Ras-like GTPase activity (Roadblock/LC7/MglB family)